MEQKLIIVALIMYFAVFIASIIKFSVNRYLTVFSAVLSIFAPVFLILFFIHFNVYVWKKDLRDLPLLKSISLAVKILKVEISMIPVMHTGVIWLIVERIKKSRNFESNVSVFKYSDVRDSSLRKLNGELRQVMTAQF